MTEVNIRQYREGDEKQIVDLLTAAFRGWPKMDMQCPALDHWKWKYLDSPLGASMIQVAEDDRIQGVIHSILHQVKIMDKVQPCHYIANMAVHPEHRQRGTAGEMIRVSIMDRRRTDVKFSYYVTSNPVMIKHNQRRDDVDEFPHRILNMVRLKDVDKQLEAMPMSHGTVVKLGYLTLKTINKVTGSLTRREPDRSTQIREINRFDNRVNDLWKKTANHYNFITKRNRDWLNWRYCDPRSGGFTVKTAEKQGELMGYIVLKINRYNKDYPVGYIVDVQAHPDDADTPALLVKDALETFDREHVNIVNALAVKGSRTQRLLGSHGFLDSRVKVHLFTFNDFPEYPKIKDSHPDTVHIAYGDLDSLPATLDRHSD